MFLMKSKFLKNVMVLQKLKSHWIERNAPFLAPIFNRKLTANSILLSLKITIPIYRAKFGIYKNERLCRERDQTSPWLANDEIQVQKRPDQIAVSSKLRKSGIKIWYKLYHIPPQVAVLLASSNADEATIKWVTHSG
jgi:hypothetical protein